MGESRHTPGPWEAFDAKTQDGEVTIGIRGDGEFIATLDVVAIGAGPYKLPPNAEANARLIAAAPELLEACKALLGEMWSGRKRRNVKKDFHLMVAEEAARTAIAKATGVKP